MKMENVLARVTAVAAILLTGCSSTSLKIPKSLSSNGPISVFSNTTFQKNLDDYTAAMRRADTGAAQVLRDQMINGIRVEIEMNYRDFEQKLYTGRATFNTAADVAELALAGATTITHGESAKTILAAILTAAKGARLSYEKNFFREKTTEAIIASMQAGRNEKLTHITESMNLAVEKYPFEQAWVDLVGFFYAGTIEGGLLALTSEAGSRAESSKQELRQAEKSRVRLLKATEEEISSTRELTLEVGKLVNAPDKAAARAKSLSILKKLKDDGVAVQFDPNDTDQKLYQKLQDQIDASTTDSTLLPKLSKAFKN